MGFFQMSITYTLQCSEDKLVLPRRGEKKKFIVPLLHLLQKLVGVGELSFEHVHFYDMLKITSFRLGT